MNNQEMNTREIALSENRSEKTIRRLIHKTGDPLLIKKLEESWFTKKQPRFTPEEVEKILGAKKNKNLTISKKLVVLKTKANLIKIELEKIIDEINKAEEQINES